MPSLTDLPLLVAVGVLGGIAQILLTKAYGMAPASVVAPFEYATLVFALVLGLILWGEFPTPMEMAGIVVIFLSNLFLIFDEQRRHSARIRRQGAVKSLKQSFSRGAHR
jgi:drug/metabolite transporter (DMT)-like permease